MIVLEDNLRMLLDNRIRLLEEIKIKAIEEYECETVLGFDRYKAEQNYYIYIVVLGRIDEDDMRIIIDMAKGFAGGGAWNSKNTDLFNAIKLYLTAREYLVDEDVGDIPSEQFMIGS